MIQIRQNDHHKTSRPKDMCIAGFLHTLVSSSPFISHTSLYHIMCSPFFLPLPPRHLHHYICMEKIIIYCWSSFLGVVVSVPCSFFTCFTTHTPLQFYVPPLSLLLVLWRSKQNTKTTFRCSCIFPCVLSLFLSLSPLYFFASHSFLTIFILLFQKDKDIINMSVTIPLPKYMVFYF